MSWKKDRDGELIVGFEKKCPCIISTMSNIIHEIILPIYQNISNYITTHPRIFSNLGTACLVGVPAYALYQLFSEFDKMSNWKTLIYIFSIGLPLYILFYLSVGKSFEGNNYSSLLTGVFVGLFLIGVMYVSLSSIPASMSSTSSVSIVMNIVLSLSIIIGLAAVFLMFSRQIKSLTGTPGFIVSLLFYIPCLCIDLFRYLSNEFRSTPLLIYYLFLFEIVLVLLYVYLPSLIKTIVNSNGTQLLENAVFLDSETEIGNALQVKKQPIDTSVPTRPVFSTNYAISMWVYLDSQSKNFQAYGKETTIFDYGNGKPKLTYVNHVDDPEQKDKVNIYFTNTTTQKPSLEVTLPKQKWNQIVFNYSTQRADVFINGSLEKTFEFADNLPTYAVYDKFVTGSNHGLDGAICNVKYYPNVLSKFEITNSYNLLMNKNPPINI
jgi:hypothetical protein